MNWCNFTHWTGTLREDIFCGRNFCGRNFCGIYFCDFDPYSQKILPQNLSNVSQLQKFLPQKIHNYFMMTFNLTFTHICQKRSKNNYPDSQTIFSINTNNCELRLRMKPEKKQKQLSRLANYILYKHE